MVLLSTILPGISTVLLRRGFDAGKKDLWITRGSIGCLAVGAFIIGLAPILSIMVTGKQISVPKNRVDNIINSCTPSRLNDLRAWPRVCARNAQSSHTVH